MNKNNPVSIVNPLPEYVDYNADEFIDLYHSPLFKYTREGWNQFGYMINQGLALDDEDNKDGPIHIDRLYIIPKASKERMAPEAMAQLEIDGQEEDADKLLNIAHLIFKNPRLTLLGDPGVGKTTLIQWLMCSFCHWGENYAKEQIGKLFPLLLTARKLKVQDTKTKLDSKGFIDLVFSTQDESLRNKIYEQEGALETLQTVLEVGQAMVLVDGLDEISPETSDWLSNGLREFLADYPKCRLLMTSRVVGFDARRFWQVGITDKEGVVSIDDIEFSVWIEMNEAQDMSKGANLPSSYYIAPFSPSHRQRFAQNWLEVFLPPNEEMRRQFLEELEKISRHSLQLNALSRIPVLLNLICFVQWRRGKLPNGRAELYQRIVETYLVTMDRARSIKDELSDEYDYQDIKNWIGKLAFQMQAGNLILPVGELFSLDEVQLEELRNQLPQIKEERLIQISESQLQRFLQLHLSEALGCEDIQLHSTQLIDYIQKRTGFLIPKGQVDGEEHYSFSHLSFQEYFAAYAISKRLTKHYVKDAISEELKNTIDMKAWGEVWQLVFEELSLSGCSRSEIDKSLGLIFYGEGSNNAAERNQWSYDKLVLYTEIIINPAVKLTSFKRVSRQMDAVVRYLDQPLISDVLIELASEYLKAPESLICKLKQNKRLNLDYIQLEDYCWIGELKQLKHLQLCVIGVGDISFLRKLKKLSFLMLKDASVKIVEHLEQNQSLETICLISSDTVDISGLISLKRLKLVIVLPDADEPSKKQLISNGVVVRSQQDIFKKLKDHNFNLAT